MGAVAIPVATSLREFEVFNNHSRRIAYLILGVLCAGLLALGRTVQTSGMGVLAEDEERPPIIVKGGSLLFESGDSKKAKKGKPWKTEDVPDAAGKNEKQWKPDHPNGIPASVLKVAFTGGTDEARRACTAIYLPEFTVLYDPDGTGPLPPAGYLVTRRAREKGQGTLAPAIVEMTLPLAPSGSADYPALIAAGTNKIFRIEYVKADGSKGWCDKPTQVEVNTIR